MADRFGLPVYSIFPDRFARGSRSRPRPRQKPWETLPEVPPRGTDFFGGDLEGVREHLDHIEALHCQSLHLTPIFAATSNHRYDTRSYSRVDRRLGADRAFDDLVAALRERGMGVVLDAVFNHVGSDHPWFREALASPTSLRRRAFHFAKGAPSYRCWHGLGSLPEWNHADRDVRRLLYEGPRSALAKWTARGATGWRIDCATDLGPRLCARITETARALGAVDGVIGEVPAYATPWLDGSLDGVTNCVFRATIVALARGEIPAQQAAWVLDRIAADYPPAGLLRSWTILGSHDTPRLATLLGEDPGRLRLAVILQYVYPGTPLIYYGDEIGMTGGPDPDNRRGMIWNEERWNGSLLELYRRMGRLRREHEVLRTGGYAPLAQPGEPEIVSFARRGEDPTRMIICVANPNARRLSAKLLLPLALVPDGLPFRDLLADRGTVCHEGFIRISLESWDVALLSPDPARTLGFDFFDGLRK